MSIFVNELRLSLIWNKASLRDTFLPCLSDADRYEAEFKAAAEGGGPWLLPWLPEQGQRFWLYYLVAAAPGDFRKVDPKAARQWLVPLRAPAFAKVKARSGVTAVFEAYCFPHSVGVVATIRLQPKCPLALGDMVDAAVAARLADFNLEWKTGGAGTHGAMNTLADKVVDWLHAKVLGQTPIGKPLKNPITIATIIDATGVYDASTGANEHLGRALNALLSFDPAWKQLNGAKVSGIGQPFVAQEVRLPDDIPPQGAVLHGLERARVIWLPKFFSDVSAKGRRTALGRYHRNLTLATLQTWALTSLVRRADEVLSTPGGTLLRIFPGDVDQAVLLLENLYRRTQSTYQSWSVKHQITFNLERINRVRAAMGKSAIGD